MSAWIVSPRYDLVWFAGPAFLGAALAAGVPPDLDLGVAGWLVLVVAVDVAHTWVTLFRTYADPVGRATYGGALVMLPLVALAASSVLQALAPGRFWAVLAFVAVFHFVRQQAGFTALYRAREGLSARGFDARVERGLVQALCVLPMVWWLTHLPRAFTWFTEGEFPALPPWTLPCAGLVTALLAATHLVFRVRSRRWSPGRDLWILATATSWTTGIVLTDGDAPFTFANVLAHGVPYFALVAHTRARQGSPLPLVALLGVPFALALAEEAGWDAAGWREHLFPPTGGLPHWVPTVATPLLAVPQLTHYLLDGVIWKMPPTSPLRRWILP